MSECSQQRGNLKDNRYNLNSAGNNQLYEEHINADEQWGVQISRMINAKKIRQLEVYRRQE
ncbi:hypothetical protein [Photorhabdus australis]|uniref:hypothetical protein n=1 Tax=Photorhabdus australis TaxID=286156 RepID=UPI0010422739|nr:hypothetical protein [Photorhabdus australis]